MEAQAIAALIGSIVGSVLTFVLTHLATNRAEKRRARLHILSVLMAGRGNIRSQEVAAAINLIPVLFHDDQGVRAAYQHFCAAVSQPFQQRWDRYSDLVISICGSLGYARKFSHADVVLGYFPYDAPPAAPAAPAPEEVTPRS